MENKVFCEACGAAIPEGSNFCVNCGRKYVQPGVTEPKPLEPVGVDLVEPKPLASAVTDFAGPKPVEPVRPDIAEPKREDINNISADTAPIAQTVTEPANSSSAALNMTQTSPAPVIFDEGRGGKPGMAPNGGKPAPEMPVPDKERRPEGKEDRKKRRGVFWPLYIVGAILSLINICMILAGVITAALASALNYGLSMAEIEAVASAKDTRVGALDALAGALPALSNYVFTGIFGVVALIVTVLLFVVFSRRKALAFRTIAIDLSITAFFTLFGLTFLNVFGSLESDPVNLDAKLFTLLRSNIVSEWLLIITAGVVCVAVVFFIIAAILDGVRHRRAVKACK